LNQTLPALPVDCIKADAGGMRSLLRAKPPLRNFHPWRRRRVDVLGDRDQGRFDGGQIFMNARELGSRIVLRASSATILTGSLIVVAAVMLARIPRRLGLTLGPLDVAPHNFMKGAALGAGNLEHALLALVIGADHRGRIVEDRRRPIMIFRSAKVSVRISPRRIGSPSAPASIASASSMSNIRAVCRRRLRGDFAATTFKDPGLSSKLISANDCHANHMVTKP
jgi:hypothetical protein